MLHCDSETLAVLALGEPLAEDERRHLQVCVQCQTELDQNKAVVATGRSVTKQDVPTDPPPALWNAIAAELGFDSDVKPALPDRRAAAEDGSAEVVSLAERRSRQESRTARRRTSWIAAAASLVGIAIGAIGASTLAGPEAAGTTIASSELRTVPVEAGGSTVITGDLSGTARIVDTDGQDYAEVDARGLPGIEGYYEVWLIRGDLSGMISLGALTSGSQGRFTIPAGTDLSLFTIIDVSVEPLNGDPTHSKESVLRGNLQV